VKIICEYIKYIAKSKGRHHIHSPFVFELVDGCFAQKVATKDKNTLAYYTSLLYQDKNNYSFDSQGAGSKRKNHYVQIKKYAENARSKGKYWELFYKISRHYQPTRILELGTNFGFGSVAFALGYSQTEIDTVEGSKTLYEINQKNFKLFPELKINFHCTSFDAFFDNQVKEKYDLIFIDGDHTSRQLFKHLEKAIAYAHNDTLILIDDIRWSADMYKAWEQIIADKRFHFTIDLFKLGIILLKENKEKEHFIIRY